MIERQELHCHDCNRYVQFNLDMELNGNHVLECPNCGHQHCRVIKDGKITSDRWDTRNQNVYYAINISYSLASTYTTSTANSSFTYSSWMNTSSGSAY